MGEPRTRAEGDAVSDSRVNWEGSEFEQRVRACLGEAAVAGAIKLQVAFKRSMGSEGGGVSHKATKKGFFVDEAGKRIAGARKRGGVVYDKKGNVVRNAKRRWKRTTKVEGYEGGLFATGKEIRVGTGRNVYRAAPAGKFPGVRTGKLRRSMSYNILEGADGTVVARVGTNVIYGRYLELGTGSMKPRPWARRNFLLNRDRIRDAMTRKLAACLKASGGAE